MTRQKQLKSLFNQLCMELNIKNYAEAKKGEKSLKLDFNSIYGGYRIDIVNENTSEDFAIYSSRMSLGEIIALIQGLLNAKDLTKRLSRTELVKDLQNELKGKF